MSRGGQGSPCYYGQLTRGEVASFLGTVPRRGDNSGREPDRTRRFFTIEGRWRHPVTQHLTVESALTFRRDRDTFSGTDEGLDFDLSLEWVVRQTEVRLTYEYSEFDDDFSDNEYSRLYVQVRRSF